MTNASFVSDAPRRESQAAREAFERVRRAERQYAVRLRKIARHIDDIVKTFGVGSAEQIRQMEAVLRRYAEIIRPWSTAAARRMLLEVARRDENAWKRNARLLGQSIRQEITSAPIGATLHALMAEQVELITSLPLEAAASVHEKALEALSTGARANQLAEEIMQTGQVTKSRANLIARTETARAATTFTMVRSQYIGSDSYIWRTARDRRVRLLHRKLEGKIFRWDDPPVSGERGERSHPGCIYNCRCFPEVIIPGKFE